MLMFIHQVKKISTLMFVFFNLALPLLSLLDTENEYGNLPEPNNIFLYFTCWSEIIILKFSKGGTQVHPQSLV